MSIDPMVAVMNDIATIDGYHNIYPCITNISLEKL